jgi:glutaminyl-peptide cyclotransferase
MKPNRRKPREGLMQVIKIYLNASLTLKTNHMRSDYPRTVIVSTLIFIIAWTLSCSGNSGKTKEQVESQPVGTAGEATLKLIKIVSPEENTVFKLHQPVKISLAAEDENKLPDSAVIYFNGKHITSLTNRPWEYSIPAENTVATGRKSLKVVAYKNGKQQNTVTRFMLIYSDVVPKQYGYKVLHTYPHDKTAFTQGLFYDGGSLYEGTGQETGSSIRETELESGKVKRQHNLDGSLFGEGITLYDNRIFQVTWKNKVGFVYDKKDFKQLNKIYYSTEGWGLTTLNDKIVMSDGSEIIYFYDPEMFTVTSKIEVYDNEKKVDKLNELEYINGEIWANIWMTDQIARIDPQSGKVLGYINLKDILQASDRTPDTDVLNGIAYDNAAKRIFVTGKLWPRLFEIKLTE